MEASIAKLSGVSLRRGTAWPLLRLSLDIPTHSAVLLTGDNGAGKTTLLRLLATAIRPTRGSISLFGRELRPNGGLGLLAIRRRLSLLTHQSYLYDDLSARENLDIAARVTNNNSQEVDTQLERVGLTAHRDRAVRLYSAGMKRRVMLARLLLCKPSLVLLDEPFGQLDPSGVTLALELFSGLRAAGATIVLATHHHDLGRKICDHSLQLHKGEISSPLAVIDEPREGAA